MARRVISLALVLGLAGPGAFAEAPGGEKGGETGGDWGYGAYLAAECTTCHQPEGGDSTIPAIVYWPQEAFIETMQAYQSGAREHAVMTMVARRLGAEEIAALAAYFAAPEE